MNIALAFHSGDQAEADRWLNWCAELGGVSRHDLWLMPAKDLDSRKYFEPSAPWAKAFKSVRHVVDYVGAKSNWSGSGPVRDASGPNACVRAFAQHFYYGKLGFWMFIEPDAIPLVPDWADRLEAEYLASGRKFMGAYVPAKANAYEAHSTGNMILPEDANNVVSLMLPSHAKFGNERVEIAFDVAAAKEILANFHPTKLIQHVFRGPTFTSVEDVKARVSPEAVLYHTSKDGALINFLRQIRNGTDLSGGVESRHATGEPALQVTTTASSELTDDRAVSRSSVRPAQISSEGGARVYCYFAPATSADFLAEQKKLLALWEASWKRNGWEPVVLTEDDARKHPRFEEWKAKFEKLPTINPPAYEMACWNRWPAMVAAGGGLMVDYDVINAGFWHFDLQQTIPNHERPFPVVLADKNASPCVTWGNRQNFENACGLFAEYIPKPSDTEHGKPHVSDQTLVQQFKWGAFDVCKEYGTEGWKTAKLVHFSHSACKGYLRSYMMETMLKDSSERMAETFSVVESGTGFTSGAVVHFSGSASPEVGRMTPELPTIVGRIREHVDALVLIIGDGHNRRQTFHKELRKAGLLPKLPMRKKKKKKGWRAELMEKLK